MQEKLTKEIPRFLVGKKFAHIRAKKKKKTLRNSIGGFPDRFAVH
jgi:hypothetical protein